MTDYDGKNSGFSFLSMGLAVLLYLASYAVLMNRKMPAQVSPGKVVFSSSFRFGYLYAEDVNEKRIYYYGPSVANYFFLPVDYVLDKCSNQ